MSTEPDSNKTRTSTTGNRHSQDKKDGPSRSSGGKRNTAGPIPRYHGSTSTHDGSVKGKGSGWESANKGRHRPLKDEHRKSRDTHTTRNVAQSGKTHNRKSNTSNKPHPPTQTNEDTVDKQEETVQTVQDEDQVAIENEAPLMEEETNGGEREDGGTSNRLVYTRDDLLLFKEVTLSLLSPVPHFDTMETEIVKEILKRHNSSSSSNNDVNEIETDLLDDLKPKHPATLSLIREHDPKTSAKVSLSPQRRSFGSGCSWRESPVKNGPQAPPTNQTNNADSAESEKDEVFYHPRVTTPSSHKVIDHIPYRSRGNGGKGEWQDPPKRRGSSWRESMDTPTGRMDEEPEWMSYGPTDCTEIMELKGLEDHELERQAIKPGTSVPVDGKRLEEGGVSSDPSPSSSVGDTTKDDYDSGLPSSSPYDDDQEFMLDGFDFSTGVSICRALASDSDEEEATPINNNNDNKEGLPAITDKHQLTNALLNVLKIPPGGTGEAPTRPLRAMTLDEIEEPRPQEVDQDQSAFNKLLAAINSPHGGPPGAGIEGHVSQGRREHQFPPTGGHVNRMLFSEESEQLQPLQLRGGGRYQSHHQEWTHPQWGGAGGVAYRPNLYKPHHSLQARPSHTLSQQSSGQQHGINWISEMELRRRSELNQIMAEKERQERQLLAAEKERQRLITQRSNNSSLSFLPTSVIRQMHSKPAGTTPPTHIMNNSMDVPPMHANSYDRDYQPPLHMLPQSSGIPFHHNTAVPHHIHSHHMGGATGINNGRTIGTPVDTMASGFTHPMQYRMTYQQQQ